MGNPASQEATSAGIASDTESLPLNTGLGHAAIAWDSDTIDEWGFLRTAINQQLTPPGKLSERRVFYGYVLEHVKSSRDCQTAPGTAGYSLPTSVADAQARIAAAGSTPAARAAKLKALEKESDASRAGADSAATRARVRAKTELENTATARSGYVRVRIPELQPLPPVPITPGNVEAQKLCNRSSKALKRAANSMVKFYPLFTYSQSFENQKFLVPGALVKVQYTDPPAPKTSGVASPQVSDGMSEHGGVKGAMVEVVLHSSGQPILAFSAYQTKKQGSDAHKESKKCSELLAGASLGFGEEALGAAGVVPETPLLTKEQKRLRRVPLYSRSGGGGKPSLDTHTSAVSGLMDYSLLGLLDHNTSERTKIDFIVLHHTGAKPKNTVNGWGPDNISSHYIIDKKGVIFQVVAEKWAGHHAACQKKAKALAKARNHPKELYCPYKSPNARSIGIDLQGSAKHGYTAATEASLVKLLEDINTRRGIPIDDEHVLAHFETQRGPFRQDPFSNPPGGRGRDYVTRPFSWNIPGLKFNHGEDNYQYVAEKDPTLPMRSDDTINTKYEDTT